MSNDRANAAELASFEVRNEFAHVRVSLDRSANGDRLAITDLRSGLQIFLDALELERLAAARHHDLATFVAPPS